MILCAGAAVLCYICGCWWTCTSLHQAPRGAAGSRRTQIKRRCPWAPVPRPWFCGRRSLFLAQSAQCGSLAWEQGALWSATNVSIASRLSVNDYKRSGAQTQHWFAGEAEPPLGLCASNVLTAQIRRPAGVQILSPSVLEMYLWRCGETMTCQACHS